MFQVLFCGFKDLEKRVVRDTERGGIESLITMKGAGVGSEVRKRNKLR